MWRAEVAGRSWTAVLRVEGPRLLGVVSSCASYPDDIAISEGRVDGSTVTFKCTSPDGARTLTFTGQLKGDRIAFTWERMGSGSVPYDAAFFGASAPSEFSATFVPNRSNPAAVDRTRTAPAVTFEQILRATETPQNWLTYSGNLQGHRYSPLANITATNVKDLALAWLSQTTTTSGQRSTPLVVDGVMYTTRNTNDVVALDGETGRALWVYPYSPMQGARASGGGGRPNRGLAVSGDTLFLGTLDAHLIAIDALTGKPRWNTAVADFKDPSCQMPGRGRTCYVITLAPLVVKDKVIVGLGGGDTEIVGAGIRGAVVAFEAATGKEVWRFHTIPGPGEPGGDTWSGESWRTGGAGVWNTGSYDPDLNLTYWGTGNPSPPGAFGPPLASTRVGDNLYSASVVALDADTGALKWHYQFTPHDDMDWDAAQVPVLADIQWEGGRRKVMLFANKNGLVYVLDPGTGEFLSGTPFVDVDWMSGFDSRGRPIRINTESVRVSPASATNWFPASHSPRTGLLYIPAWNRSRERGGFTVRGPSHGSITAFNPQTGKKDWEFRLNNALFTGGVLTTASDLLFTGTSSDFFSDAADARGLDGFFFVLDARTGAVLWKFGLPGPIQSPAITYQVRGKQVRRRIDQRHPLCLCAQVMSRQNGNLGVLPGFPLAAVQDQPTISCRPG